MKTSGFNFQDILEDNKNADSIFNIEGNKNMEQELKLKKKKKINFDNILPRVKEKNMGMDNLEGGMFGKGFFD